MSFTEIALNRQSCRSYDPDREVEDEKLEAILNSARLSPSACNSQPYHITVCKGDKAKEAARACRGMGMNKFASKAPVMLVISEAPYNKTAAMGAKLKDNDYRSIDIGIMTAFITAEATDRGLGSCILGWFDDKKLREICGIESKVRLAVTIGYPSEDDKLRDKKRKDIDELVTTAP